MSQYPSNQPLLDARLQGCGTLFTTNPGNVKTFYYTFPFDCFFNGIEIITDLNVSLGDNVTLSIEYYNGVSWVLYKKFGKNWYIKPNDRDRLILFPSTPKSGTRLRIDYDSKGVATVNFVVNLFTFVDQQTVNPSLGEMGEDW